jgi:hypothetical protein
MSIISPPKQMYWLWPFTFVATEVVHMEEDTLAAEEGKSL